MCLTVELQRQFPVWDIPAGAVEGGCVLPALASAEHEVGIRGSAQASGAGDHVHGVIVVHLPQVVDEQDGDAVPVRQGSEDADVPVVAGVGIAFVPGRPDTLQGVDDHQTGGRMFPEELLDLIQKPAVELLRHHGKVQCRRRILGEIQQAVLDALKAVLQAEVENFAGSCGKIPEGFSLGHLEAKPQGQPGLADFRCSRQQVEALGQQVFHDEQERFVGDAQQGIRVNGV